MFPPSTIPLVEFAGTCVEQTAAREAPRFDEARLDRFGPLGTTPAIEFPVPDGPPLPDGFITRTGVSATRIPGGVLVMVSADYGNAERILTAIDHDGRVRWQRCFDGGYGDVIAANASARPTEVLLADDRRSDGTQISTMSVISLADGRETGTLSDIVDAADLATPSPALTTVANGPGRGQRSVLLSGDIGSTADEAATVLDLVDMTVSTVPAPPPAAVDVEGDGIVIFSANDRLVRMDTLPNGRSRVTAVLLDGEWVTDDDVIAEESPITVSPYVPFDSTLPGFNSLKATDHTGALVWEREDVMLINAEGFWFGSVDDVAIAISCIDPVSVDGISSCDAGFRTGGYDLATGETIWERDGYRGSAIGGDGHMLAPVTDGGWEMLDARTGERVQADQEWAAPFAFSTECCGGDATQRAERHGGIVLTVSEGMVRIYLPQWASHPTVSLELI